MKTLAAVLVGLAVAMSANIAAAYVVVVTTAVPITRAAAREDPTRLGAALESAIRDVLDHAIAFTPAVVTLEQAKIVGDQLYVVLVIADEDGQSALEALSKDPEAEREPGSEDGADPSAGITL